MRCFLDVDGVLCDFIGGASRLLGVRLDPWPAAGVWDFFPHVGLTEREFWAEVEADPTFWAGLLPTADHGPILSAVEGRFGPQNVCLLTSPPADPYSLAGKCRWIRAYLPEYSRRFLIGPAKEFAAHAGAVLVDDSDANVRRFRAAGGAALLLPRPWNARHAEAADAADVLAAELAAELAGWRASDA